ncbi:hypothetical protein ACYPKM_02645 [Pseudomonas aeruginosa]
MGQLSATLAGYIHEAKVTDINEKRQKLTIVARLPNGRVNGEPHSEFFEVVHFANKGRFDSLLPHLVAGQAFAADHAELKFNENTSGTDKYYNEHFELVDLFDLELIGGAPTSKNGKDLSEGRDNTQQPQSQAPQQQSQSQPAPQPAPDYDSFDDDIPF